MDIYDIRNALSSGKTIYDLPLRVTYYARVSTDKDEQLHSLSAQIRYYNEFIRRNPQWDDSSKAGKFSADDSRRSVRPL